MHTSKVLSGKDTAVAVYASFKNRLDILSKKGIIPGLCVILVGDDPASQIYVKTKSKKLQSLGLRSKNIYLKPLKVFVDNCNIRYQKLMKFGEHGYDYQY